MVPTFNATLADRFWGAMVVCMVCSGPVKSRIHYNIHRNTLTLYQLLPVSEQQLFTAAELISSANSDSRQESEQNAPVDTCYSSFFKQYPPKDEHILRLLSAGHNMIYGSMAGLRLGFCLWRSANSSVERYRPPLDRWRNCST